MSERMTAAQIIYVALVWAEENMVQMVHGCPADDPYRAEVADQLRQLKRYHKRRFGVEQNPFEGCKTMTLEELRRSR